MKQDVSNISTKENPVGRFMVAAGAVIELRDTGKILLVQRSSTLDWHPGEWEIIYGRLDQYESPETGLKREVFEEIGINDLFICDVLRVWHIYRGTKKADNELIGITYRCRTDYEVIKLSTEHTDYKWVMPEEAVQIVEIVGIQKDILKYIENRNRQ